MGTARTRSHSHTRTHGETARALASFSHGTRHARTHSREVHAHTPVRILRALCLFHSATIAHAAARPRSRRWRRRSREYPRRGREKRTRRGVRVVEVRRVNASEKTGENEERSRSTEIRQSGHPPPWYNEHRVRAIACTRSSSRKRLERRRTIIASELRCLQTDGCRWTAPDDSPLAVGPARPANRNARRRPMKAPRAREIGIRRASSRSPTSLWLTSLLRWSPARWSDRGAFSITRIRKWLASAKCNA